MKKTIISLKDKHLTNIYRHNGGTTIRKEIDMKGLSRKGLKPRTLPLFFVSVIFEGVLSISGTALAYGENELKVTEILFDATDCDVEDIEGDMEVIDFGHYCRVVDGADDAFFRLDSNSTAYKANFYDSSDDLVAKVEFHPYGEHLWVYDTKDDGDTIYVVICEKEIGTCYGPYSAPGTGEEFEFIHQNFDFKEHEEILILVYDDLEITDKIELKVYQSTIFA